ANFWKDVIFSKQNICVVSALSELNHVIKFPSLQVAIMQGTQSDYVKKVPLTCSQTVSEQQKQSDSNFSRDEKTSKTDRKGFSTSQVDLLSEESENTYHTEKCRKCLFKYFVESFSEIYKLFCEWVKGLSQEKSQCSRRRRNSRSDLENSMTKNDDFDYFAGRKKSNMLDNNSSQNNYNKKSMMDDLKD
ncbi:MAG: hypothetical protein Q4B70_19440, partial [Lachnospiraceae bacterium]|nr:hypothetical protein [Lachnospiraceae bacterium]